MLANPYTDFVSGRKSLGFTPTGNLNREVYWTIKNKYPRSVDDALLFEGVKKHLSLLTTASGADPGPLNNLAPGGRILVEYLKAYQGKVDRDLAVYAAARGMVESLEDEQCRIILPSEDEDPRSGVVPADYGGLGILIEERNNRIVIIHPFSGGPGSGGGLKPGDVITSIDGTPVSGQDLDTVMNRLRGPVGSQVSLNLTRKGKAFSRTLARARVTPDPIHPGILQDKFGYLKIVFFGEEYPREVYNAVDTFRKKGIVYWILDLRDNSGGFLNNIVVMSSLFIPSQKPVMYIKYRDEEKANTSVARRNIQWPVIILVNRYTTGSAEVLAGTLREYTDAKIVGATTRGNAAVSEYFKLKDGPTLQLTVGEMLTGHKTTIHRVGVKPDVELKGVDDPANEEEVLNTLLKMIKQ